MKVVKSTWLVISAQLVLFSVPSWGATFGQYFCPSLRGKEKLGISPEVVSDALLGDKLGVESKVSVDLEGGFITREKRKGRVLLVVTEAQDLGQYLDGELKRKTKEALLGYAKISLAKRREKGGSGLVPTLELPTFRLPVVGGFIGEGGELKVDGSQRIEFGGRETFELDRKYQPGEKPSYFPELEMKQNLLVNLQGTVGEKIHVFVDHNSEAESQSKNKIKLQYKGDEDEIVQEIEAGDTQLSLPGTRLIGGPTTHRGLFGIRTLARVGPLDVTAIASKEQAETEERSFVGETTLDTLMVWDTEYERWQFFTLDLDPLVDDILEVHVFVDDAIGSNNVGTFTGKAYLDPQNPDTCLHEGQFDLEYQGMHEYYTFDEVNNILELRRGMEAKGPVLAVSYVRKLRSGEVDTVGTVKKQFQQGDTLALKLIKPGFPDPQDPAWDYELKNVYSIGSSNIISGSFELTIYKDSPEGGRDLSFEDGVPYIQLLGLDSNGDGMVDDYYIDETAGLLRFPHLRPFCRSDVLEEPDCAIYDTLDLGAGVGRKYYMVMKYKGKAASYNLGINIIEGSEEITVGRKKLEKGKDYRIDYETGMITFISEEPFLYPDADINIRYQTSPFFTLTSRSLLGTRGVYRIGDNSQLGTSLIYRSEGRREERPKLGEEPRRIALGEIDGSINAEPYLFTRMVDLLPFVDTEAPSRFSLTGEAAASFPDPNTMGEAYVDDMEATEVKDDLGVSFTRWRFGSVPDGKDTASLCSELRWYNPEDKIRAGDLDSLLPEDQRDDLLPVLNLVMAPKDSDTSSWGSILTCLSSRGVDYSESKFIELWARGETGELHLELGENIPEDAPRRNSRGEILGLGVRDTEDQNKDGRLDEDEDTGLDGVQGEDGQKVLGDDWNDDYHYTPGSEDYSKINGTEDNDRLDEEDLDGNGSLNSYRDYSRFSISMEETTRVVRWGKSGWKLLRIPLADSAAADTAVGTMDWQTVRYARLWMSGFGSQDSIQLQSLDLVGNRWREEEVSWASGDSVLEHPKNPEPEELFYVTVKNNYQHSDYIPPYDPGKDSFGRKKREQSLVLGFENLRHNRQGSCYSLKTRADDYTNYGELKFYLHGDGSSTPTFFIRFGADSSDYYEYKTVVQGGWREIAVDFRRLIDLKVSKPDSQDYLAQGAYGVRGRPALTDVKRISLGVVNEGEELLSGEVWVDEIRLAKVRRERGVSANLSLGLQFADLLSFDLSVNRSGAEFRTLGQDKPSMSNSTSFAASGDLNLHKFLPESWGVSLPFRTTFGKDLSYPKYYSGSDIILDEEESKEQRALSERRTFSLDFSKRRSANRLLQLMLDPITIRNQLSRSFSHRFEQADSTESFTSSVSYSYSPQLKPIKLRFLELSYFPQQFSLSAGYNRNRSRRYVRGDTVWVLDWNPRPRRNLTGATSFTYRPHRTLSTGYQLNVTRDLTLEEEPAAYDLGKEIGRIQRANASFTPSISSLLSPSLSFVTNYTENHSPDEVRAPPPDTALDVRDVANQNTKTLNLTVNLSEAVSKLTSLRDESRDSLVGSPHWIAKQIETISRKIMSPTASYSMDRQSQFRYLKERPSWEYQLGLRDSLEGVGKIPSDEDYMSEANSFSLRSGMNLTFLGLTTSYASNESEGGRGGNRTIARSRVWPNVNLTLGPFRTLGSLKQLTECSISSSFTSKRDRSWTKGKESEMRITRSSDFSPLVGVRATLWKKVSSNLAANYGVVETEEQASENITRRTSKGARLSLAYSFSAPTGINLPLLRRIRFKSDLNTTVNLEYDEDHEKSELETEARAHTVSYSVSPAANYNFSQSVVGGLSGEYVQRRDKKTGKATRTVGLRFSVEFKF